MAKKRIYQLAKETGLSAEAIIATLNRIGIEVKSNLSSIDPEVAARVKSALAKPAGVRSRPDAPAAPRARASTKIEPPPKVRGTRPALASRGARKGKPVLIPAPGRPALARPGRPPSTPQGTGRLVSSPPSRTKRPSPPGSLAREQLKPGSRPAGPVRVSHPSYRRPRPIPAYAKPGRRPPGRRPQRRPRRARHEAVSSQPSPAVAAPPQDPSTFKEITLAEGVTVKELAEKMERKSKDVIQSLISKGILATLNQALDGEAARRICNEFGFQPKMMSFEENIALEETGTARDEAEVLVPRAPVVTMMGHVDHGKTSLLDAIRKTTVAESEHGGITQHIGAYQVAVGDRKVVFLDTPGHEAFTRMRARGAQVTDLVVLVVAADDGVMPQTVEAIHHARAAEVPLIVAMNKMDKPDADPERVKKSLSANNVLVEEWGGDVVCVPVSAKQCTGLDHLLEMILLTGDLLELRANPARLAAGTVLEARLDRTRGPVATVLIRNGTLHIGDSFIMGAEHGKVRAMVDDRGTRVTEAGPSAAVEILGLEGVPEAGDLLQGLVEDRRARQIGAFRQERVRKEKLLKTSRMSLEHLFDQIKGGAVKELRIILKADVQGSAEVVGKSLQDLATEKVKVKVIHTATGAVNESDVLLASASNAIIVGFNVRPERSAQALAEKEDVDIRLHTVIYNVTDEIKKAMAGLLEPVFKEVYLGRAEVRALFKVPRAGTVAGCTVIDGRIPRSAEVRLLRDNVVVCECKVASLRRFKEDVAEVKEGFECGISLVRFSDLKVNDIIESFATEKTAQEL
ncbi:MAG: translation initiation factor IF-2 [Acidobacteriota bacterium]